MPQWLRQLWDMYDSRTVSVKDALSDVFEDEAEMLSYFDNADVYGFIVRDGYIIW